MGQAHMSSGGRAIQKVNIYTDSHYAFATLHVHGVICQERGPLTVGGKYIKNSQEISSLLQAVWLPSKMTASKRQVNGSPGNQAANPAAKQAALGQKPHSAHVLVTPYLNHSTIQKRNLSGQSQKEPLRRMGGRFCYKERFFSPRLWDFMYKTYVAIPTWERQPCQIFLVVISLY